MCIAAERLAFELAPTLAPITDSEFVQAVLAQLPWYRQLVRLDKLRTDEERRWYAAKAIENNRAKAAWITARDDLQLAAPVPDSGSPPAFAGVARNDEAEVCH